MQPSTKAQELFDRTRHRILGVPCAHRLWVRALRSAEKRKLGHSFRDAFETYPCAASMWVEVKRVNYSRAVIEVAESLNLLTSTDADWLLREGGEIPRDPVEAEQAAIERGDLVFSIKDRKIFWSGKECEIPFGKHTSLWDFWRTSCEAAVQGEGVGWDSFGAAKSETYVADKKNKLSSLPGFPIELIDRYVSDGTGRQRLDLEAERIHFFW